MSVRKKKKNVFCRASEANVGDSDVLYFAASVVATGEWQDKE
jgi:hypothetical protein